MFSDREKLLLKILGRRKMTVMKITDEFYHSIQEKIPFEGNIRVNSMLNRIQKKCNNNDECNWTLYSKGAGRRGKTVWRGGKHG